MQLVLFAFMGVALWLLTDGLHGIATTVSRLGAAVFVVFYGAGDTLLGIATGILARGARDLPTEVHEGRAEAIAMLFEDPIAQVLYGVGELGWLVSLLAAVIALRGRLSALTSRAAGALRLRSVGLRPPSAIRPDRLRFVLSGCPLARTHAG